MKWVGVIRKTFFDGGVDEVITTRRLVHIVQAYQIFGDRLDAITKCINRFDDDTKQSFLDLYTKVDAGEDSEYNTCLLYTSPSPRDLSTSRMPSSA